MHKVPHFKVSNFIRAKVPSCPKRKLARVISSHKTPTRNDNNYFTSALLFISYRQTDKFFDTINLDICFSFSLICYLPTRFAHSPAIRVILFFFQEIFTRWNNFKDQVYSERSKLKSPNLFSTLSVKLAFPFPKLEGTCFAYLKSTASWQLNIK